MSDVETPIAEPTGRQYWGKCAKFEYEGVKREVAVGRDSSGHVRIGFVAHWPDLDTPAETVIFLSPPGGNALSELLFDVLHNCRPPAHDGVTEESDNG